VVVTSVRVAATGRLLRCELLCCRGLRLGVEIFNLGLAEDAIEQNVNIWSNAQAMTFVKQVNSHPGVACGGLVDIRLVDNEEDLRRM
jgi:hypothetical protein